MACFLAEGTKPLPEPTLIQGCWHPFQCDFTENALDTMAKIIIWNYIFIHLYASSRGQWVNTLRPRQNGCHFTDDIFKCLFVNENIWISIKISLQFVPKGPMNNIPALVQIMAWRRSCDKPLSEPMMASLQTPIYVTRPQWVNQLSIELWIRHVRLLLWVFHVHLIGQIMSLLIIYHVSQSTNTNISSTSNKNNPDLQKSDQKNRTG